MKILEKFMDYFNKALLASGVVFLVGVCFFCITQVVCRFILKVGLTGTEEMTKFCFTWMICLCAGLCVKDQTNPSISIFKDMLRGKVQIAHDILIHTVIIIFGVLFIVLGIPYVQTTAFSRFGALSFSVAYLNASIIAAGIGIAMNGLNNMIHLLANLFRPAEENAESGGLEL